MLRCPIWALPRATGLPVQKKFAASAAAHRPGETKEQRSCRGPVVHLFGVLDVCDQVASLLVIVLCLKVAGPPCFPICVFAAPPHPAGTQRDGMATGRRMPVLFASFERRLSVRWPVGLLFVCCGTTTKTPSDASSYRFLMGSPPLFRDRKVWPRRYRLRRLWSVVVVPPPFAPQDLFSNGSRIGIEQHAVHFYRFGCSLLAVCAVRLVTARCCGGGGFPVAICPLSHSEHQVITQ